MANDSGIIVERSFQASKKKKNLRLCSGLHVRLRSVRGRVRALIVSNHRL